MNPVVLAVCLMLILSLARVHVVFSLIISAFVGGLVANIPAITNAIDQARTIAEQESGKLINSMMVSISGEHILGVNSDNRIPVRNHRISDEDIIHTMIRAFGILPMRLRYVKCRKNC